MQNVCLFMYADFLYIIIYKVFHSAKCWTVNYLYHYKITKLQNNVKSNGKTFFLDFVAMSSMTDNVLPF